MKIAHIVTYLSPDGAFGGPARVALNQASELAKRGHKVVVFAAGPVHSEVTERTEEGVLIRTFPAKYVLPRSGFAGMRAAGMTRALKKADSYFDLAHIHLARDLVTIPAASTIRSTGLPYVVQPHGMLDLSTKILAKPLDKLLTIPTLRMAERVFFLTESEKADLELVAGKDQQFERLANGVPDYGIAPEARKTGPFRVAFLARIHRIKRPEIFVRAAIELINRGAEIQFTVAGPDEGELTRIMSLAEDAAIQEQIRFDGAISPEKVPSYLSDCDVYVLPSESESFGMSILEAMILGKPVIITETCGLAAEVADAKAGIVVSLEQKELEKAILRLASDPELRTQMGAAARRLALRFSMDSVTDTLISAYEQVRTR